MWPILVLLFACAKDEPPPVIKAVYFESGQTQFATPADDTAVVERAARILETTEFSVVVVGLADTEGDAAMNKALAQKRADHVASLLREKSKGVGAKRIETFALGEKFATSDAQGERKVEFVFYTDRGQSVQQVVDNARALRDDRSGAADKGGKTKGK
jgi:outer membrane protein OmpA-like peptidoglycan-associated protein